jgi:hypothetical protein
VIGGFQVGPFQTDFQQQSGPVVPPFISKITASVMSRYSITARVIALEQASVSSDVMPLTAVTSRVIPLQ